MASSVHSDVPQVSSQAVDNIPLPPKPPTALREHVTEIQKAAPHFTPSREGKKRFDHIDVAYQQALSGRVRVPRCLLSVKPDMLRLMSFASAEPPSIIHLTEAEIQAIRNLYPPVTKDSLKELELSAIQNNLTLRQDLCFDQGLYFQPVSGSKGYEKQRHAKIYWDSLSIELQTHLHVLHGSCQDCGYGLESNSYSIPSRLPEFFATLRDLLEMLVPEADKEDVKQWLDTEWLVRLVRIGQFEAARFSEWLSKLLMSHCAPMRDEMAREMHQKISEGAQAGDMDLLVNGLSLLFTLLEKMKLDVANHQIRSFKFLLIADTVPFLKDCFSKMIESGQLDLSCSRSWVQELVRAEECRSSASTSRVSTQSFNIFVRGVAGLSTTSREELPEIFAYDKERLDVLHMDFVDMVQWQICENTLEELMLEWSGRKPTALEIEQCLSRVLQLIMPTEGYSEGVECHLHPVAVEIARAAAGISADTVSGTPKLHTEDVDFQFALGRLRVNLYTQHAEIAKQTALELDELVLQHADRFRRMETLQVSQDQRSWALKRSSSRFLLGPELEDIARRLAHIAVLSWQVWSDLLFINDS
ncbi:Protein SOSEKI 1 [Neophaeococcomyces mojaviensis]|uniref:Protein SOSEKI 1 n=1 Tax=Neophaeococcomyces mojaviensis TaxID=3383035 RepID=A0ACC3AK95_9EURO|nr:Protein SOSEKI 1 [Knufia sp. JES_112]